MHRIVNELERVRECIHLLISDSRVREGVQVLLEEVVLDNE